MALLRCDSSGELYPLHARPSTASSGTHQALLAAPDTELWHSWLGHLGRDSLHRILHSFGYSCSKSASHTCHACRLGKHVRLPFSESNNVASFPFQLLHCDVWTSPVFSNSGYKFYLVILDDYSHYTWTFSSRHKSDVLPRSSRFMPSFAHNSASPFSVFRLTMAGSSTTLRLALSLPHMALPLRLTCPIHLNRMVVLNVCFEPSTIACALCFSMPTCLRRSGQTLSPLPPIC